MLLRSRAMYCSSPAAACTSLAPEYSSSQSKSRSSSPMSLPLGVVAPFPSLKFRMLINSSVNFGSASKVKPSPLQLTTRLSTFPVLERPGPILPTRLISIELSRTCSKWSNCPSSETATKSSPCNQWRHSGPSIDIADGSRSLEQVKKRGRRQVVKTVQRFERHSRLGQSWEALPERVGLHLLRCDEQLVALLRTTRTRVIWNLLASAGRSLRGTHRLRRSTSGCWAAETGSQEHGPKLINKTHCIANTGTWMQERSTACGFCGSTRVTRVCGFKGASSSQTFERSSSCEVWPFIFLPTRNYQGAISSGSGNAQIPLVAPKTARGHSDFVLTSGPCGFARDTILVQFQQSKMSQETTYSTLSASGAFLGARSCGASATRNDGQAHVSHDANAFQFVHLFLPSEQLIGFGWLAASTISRKKTAIRSNGVNRTPRTLQNTTEHTRTHRNTLEHPGTPRTSRTPGHTCLRTTLTGTPAQKKEVTSSAINGESTQIKGKINTTKGGGVQNQPQREVVSRAPPNRARRNRAPLNNKRGHSSTTPDMGEEKAALAERKKEGE